MVQEPTMGIGEEGLQKNPGDGGLPQVDGNLDIVEVHSHRFRASGSLTS